MDCQLKAGRFFEEKKKKKNKTKKSNQLSKNIEHQKTLYPNIRFYITKAIVALL